MKMTISVSGKLPQSAGAGRSGPRSGYSSVPGQAVDRPAARPGTE